MITCPKFVQVNGSLEPASYEIQEGDVIETRNFYTVGQVAEFMDVEVDTDYDILVNNREADFGTLVYENFSIEWKVLSFGVADEPYEKKNIVLDVADNSVVEDTSEVLEDTFESDEDIFQSEEDTFENEEDTLESEESSFQSESVQEAVQPEPSKAEGNAITVYVNGETVPMTGKKDYIFVDIFDRITFDLAAGKGRAIATLINGRDAAFSELLHDGDQIELYWKEN